MRSFEKIISVKRPCPFCDSTQIKYCEESDMNAYPVQFIQCCGCGITFHVESEVSGQIFWHYGLSAYKEYLEKKSKEETE